MIIKEQMMPKNKNPFESKVDSILEKRRKLAEEERLKREEKLQKKKDKLLARFEDDFAELAELLKESAMQYQASSEGEDIYIQITYQMRSVKLFLPEDSKSYTQGWEFEGHFYKTRNLEDLMLAMHEAFRRPLNYN
jgi:hypothetical protein